MITWCAEELGVRELFEAGTADLGGRVASAMSQLLRDSSVQHKLTDFASTLIRRSRAPAEVVVYACGLINRINYQVRGSLNSHNIKRYFFGSIVIAYDLVCQESPTLESWTIISRNKFTLQQVLLLQQAFLSVISWNIFIERPTFIFVVEHLLGSQAKGKQTTSTESISRVGGTIMNSRFASVCHSVQTSDYSSDTDSN